jgi:ApaG protein
MNHDARIIPLGDAKMDVYQWLGRSKGRWDGDTLVVEGDGVVGQFPKLEPGQTFSYNSYHVIKAESTATGTFFGTTQTGQPVCVKIPRFEMHPPMLA